MSHIFPHATAAAENTVAEHQEPQKLVFYAGWFCPFAHRTWIALEEKGIPYQYKEVNPYKKESHFLAINPKGLVPAVEYNGKVLYESLILCEFLEDAFPTCKPDLLPSEPYERARARLWIDYINKVFLPSFLRVVQAQGAEVQKQALEELYVALRKLAQEIQGPYFFGQHFSLVDIAIAPWIIRDYVVTEYRGYKRSEVGEKWERYTAIVEDRPSLLKTQSLKEHYTEIYLPYLRNEAQGEAARAVREGRVIP